MKTTKITIKTTKQIPHSEVKALIESAFHYKEPHHYDIDFLPLFHNEFKSSHLLAFDHGQIIGHLGYCLRELIINNIKVPIAFIGGIAVEQKYRGHGLFKEMMKRAIDELDSRCAAIFLWSSEAQLYEKFSFHEVGSVYQWGEHDYNPSPSVAKKTLSSLSDDHIKMMTTLYEHCWPNRIARSAEQWQAFRKISSVTAYLDFQNDVLHSYALEGKGFDLGGIIHEYASHDMEKFKQLNHEARIWSPIPCGKDHQRFWLGMCRKTSLWPWPNIDAKEFFANNQILIGGIDSI